MNKLLIIFSIFFFSSCRSFLPPDGEQIDDFNYIIRSSRSDPLVESLMRDNDKIAIKGGVLYNKTSINVYGVDSENECDIILDSIIRTLKDYPLRRGYIVVSFYRSELGARYGLIKRVKVDNEGNFIK